MPILVAGCLGWWIWLGTPALRVDASSLARVPTQIAHWRATDVPLSSEVERELRADYHIQRAYVAPAEDSVWVYVGYYGTNRGGRPEHTPRGCYAGAGWTIEESRTVSDGSAGALRATEFLVEKNGERQLVHFWYRSHRRTGMLGGFDQNVDHLLGRLLDGRADGALVRLSTPVIQRDGIQRARARLLEFADLLDPILADYWPREVESS